MVFAIVLLGCVFLVVVTFGSVGIIGLGVVVPDFVVGIAG